MSSQNEKAFKRVNFRATIFIAHQLSGKTYHKEPLPQVRLIFNYQTIESQLVNTPCLHSYL